MTALLASVFVASLAGSLHCGGMCGPLVVIAAHQDRHRSRPWRLALAYHGSRLVTYLALGLAAGSAGALMNLAAVLAGMQPIAVGVAGGLMILLGLVELWRRLGGFWPAQRFSGWLPPSLFARAHAKARTLGPMPRAAVLGLVTGFLPCGWLYAFAVVAAGSGGALAGAAVMAVFWLGTLPVLAAVGLGAGHIVGRLGRYAPFATAVLLVAVGLVTLSTRSLLSAERLIAAADEMEVTERREVPPCCREKEIEMTKPE